MENNQKFCIDHSGQCIRLDHLERRVCHMEKLGLKILIGIGFNLVAVIGGIIMIYIKVHV
jgi:hypothetical protein